MIKALVITTNIKFIQNLADEIDNKNLGIRLYRFSETKQETLEILKQGNIGIIFLDKAIENDYDKSFMITYEKCLIKLLCSKVSSITAPTHMKTIKLVNLDERKRKVINELKYIGYNFTYKGTYYLVDTILEMYEKQRDMIDNLQSDIYPVVARKYSKNMSNIKSSINTATDHMYSDCDAQKLIEYFHFCYDTKPTIKQVVFAVLNKLYRDAN